MPAFKKKIPVLTLLTFVLLCVPLFVFADEAGAIEKTLWSIVNMVFGFFMGLAGKLLNVSIEQFVVGFGNQFLNSGVGMVVDALWINVRDLFNITFIFALVYLGFKMILNSDDSGTRRWLIHIILAALLVNFSLFFTKFIVDMTNILAMQIVQAGFETATGGYHISEAFMDSLGLASLWASLPPNASYGYIFGAAMLFIVGTFVFATGAILLIIRYAALCLYMTLSPLMFLGWVFPQLQGIASDYWRGFLGRAFFAPAYILLLYFAKSILDGFYKVGNAPNFAGALGGTPSGKVIDPTFIATLPPFILSCIFLIAAVVVANKLGADGAGAALKIGNDLRGRAQRGVTKMAGGATLGVAARTGRNTVGRGANYLINSDKYGGKFKDYAGKSAIGKMAYQATGKVASSSFDARQVAGLGAATGLGTGVAGGYAKSVEDRKKADADFAKSLGKRDIYNEDGSLKDEYAEEVSTTVNNDETVTSAINNNNNAKTNHSNATNDAEAAKNNLTTVKEQFDSAKDPLVDRLKKLEENYQSATSPDTKQMNQDLINATKKEISEIDNKFETQLNQATEQVATTEAQVEKATGDLNKAKEMVQKSIEVATAKAEASATYGRQIDYIKQVERQATFWKNPIATLSGSVPGAISGGTVGAAVAGVGVASVSAASVGGLIAGTAVNAHGARAQESAKHLRDIYGADGTKMAKKDKREKDLDILKVIQKELDAKKEPEA